MSKDGSEPAGALHASAAAGTTAAAEVTRPGRGRGSKARPQNPAQDVLASVDLKSHELYLNRELTWLRFNRRVLHEARDERNPLLERLKFLAIVNGNLDEFFMKRIGGLKQLVSARIQDVTVDGRTP
ncbi:MAG: RNA degradosome polyphosphate kinase, partial [Pseudomonadota bacterium]